MKTSGQSSALEAAMARVRVHRLLLLYVFMYCSVRRDSYVTTAAATTTAKK